ncbi:MAG: glycan-binding surface protein [Bacteroidales bacterium]|nr:glycan-binding surface protein [Bacteroidales bacterium]
MKSIKYICLSLLTVGALTSCNSDDEYFDSKYQSEAISVSKVYLEDAESSVPDREVDFARLGQMIRLEGKGFMGMKKVYINGYDTYFNRAYVTDNSMLITLNSKTPVVDAEDDVRNTIRLVKDETEYTYSFTIRAASPTITDVDKTLPIAGETVTVYGTGLQEITEITLPGGVSVTSGILSDDEDGEWFSFVMPQGVTEAGSIYATGANGQARSPEYFNDMRTYIINFDGKGVLGSWSSTYGSDQYATDPLGTGRGNCIMLVPQDVIADGGVGAGTQGLYWATAGNDNAEDDWNWMTSYIDGATAVGNVGIQLDIYCPEPWSNGQLEISLQNNLSNYGYGSACTKHSDSYTNQAAVWIPWLDTTTGEITPWSTGDQWVTVTIPMNQFGAYDDPLDDDRTFQTVIDDRNSGSYRNFLIFLSNSDIELTDATIDATPFTTPIYIDNIRVVNTKTYVISDFPEDEEE